METGERRRHADRGYGGRAEGGPASRRSPWSWVLAFIVLAALAAAAPFVYKRYFTTPEGRARMEADAEKLKQKLMEMKERAEEHVPTELGELEELADKLKQKAGTVRDEAAEELRERGLTPAELKKKIDELRRKLAK